PWLPPATSTPAGEAMHSHHRQPPIKALCPTVHAHVIRQARRRRRTMNVTVEESRCRCCRTHHGRAILAPIQAVHHDDDDEHIPDPLRPQADIDHSGHTRPHLTVVLPKIYLPSKPSLARPRSNDPGLRNKADDRRCLRRRCCRTSITPPLRLPPDEHYATANLSQMSITPSHCCLLSISAITIHSPDNASAHRRRAHVHRPAATHNAASLACHCLARPLLAARHLTRQQCRHGRVSPIASHGDIRHCRH
ncbi:hypothetical protein ACLOJK_034706, partial [Asimina triloba]